MNRPPFRSLGRRVAAVVAAGALVAGFASAAGADDVYNTLDITVDADYEAMNLVVPGPDATTTLKITAVDTDGHPNCNIQGGPFDLEMSAMSSNPGVASASFVGDNTFEDCGSTLTVSVHPIAAGSTIITFSGTPLTPGGADPHGTWSYGNSAFVVNVTDSITPPPPTVCDADPAAPAWANAILKAYGAKNKTVSGNAVSSVAKHMGPQTNFDGVEKFDHVNHAYEAAVYAYLDAMPAVTASLPAVPDWSKIVRPGWECTQVPPSA